MEGSSRAAAAHAAEQGMPLNPCVSILCEPPGSHTHRQEISPNHTPASDADQTPSSALQRTRRPQTSTPALLCPLACFPLPNHQLPYLTPWPLHSPVPQSCTPFTGPRNSQVNTLKPICLNFVCSKSTINFAHPQLPPLMCPISMSHLFQTDDSGESGHVLVHNPGIILPRPRVDP